MTMNPSNTNTGPTKSSQLHFMNLTPGQKITLLRKKHGKSQSYVAGRLQLALKTYQRIEEDFLYPSDLLLHKISDLYGITYPQLLAIGEV